MGIVYRVDAIHNSGQVRIIDETPGRKPIRRSSSGKRWCGPVGMQPVRSRRIFSISSRVPASKSSCSSMDLIPCRRRMGDLPSSFQLDYSGLAALPIFRRR